MKYKSSYDVVEALLNEELKRESAQASKRRYKKKGNIEMYELLQKGLSTYDLYKSNKLVCPFYKTPINHLDILQVVDLFDNQRRLFTYDHAKRYSILMFGETDTINIEDYKGAVIYPTEEPYLL